MKKLFLVLKISLIFTGCESLIPKSHHETGLNPEVQGHINRQKADDMMYITDTAFDIADTLLK